MSETDTPPPKKSLWDRIRLEAKQAFSIQSSGKLSEDDYKLLDRLAGMIVQRGMAAPAILALQSVIPLGFLGSQAMVAFQPFAELFVPPSQYEQLAQILERREGVEILITRIEKAQNEP